MKVLIALPAYNEEAAISHVLENIRRLREKSKHNIYVLVVNDGSTDKTAEIVESIKAADNWLELVNHELNKGLGEAVKTILNYAVARLDDEDLLVTLDADNTHSPELIEHMVDYLIADDLDIVVASRFAKGGAEIGLSLIRKIYSRGAKYFFKAFFPIRNLNDYSSGFRVYKVKCLKEAKQRWHDLVTTSGFDCMAEIAAKISRMNIKAGEVPLVLRYDLKQGRSKMQVGKTIKGYFSLLAKVR